MNFSVLNSFTGGSPEVLKLCGMQSSSDCFYPLDFQVVMTFMLELHVRVQIKVPPLKVDGHDNVITVNVTL